MQVDMLDPKIKKFKILIFLLIFLIWDFEGQLKYEYRNIKNNDFSNGCGLDYRVSGSRADKYI